MTPQPSTSFTVKSYYGQDQRPLVPTECSALYCRLRGLGVPLKEDSANTQPPCTRVVTSVSHIIACVGSSTPGCRRVANVCPIARLCSHGDTCQCSMLRLCRAFGLPHQAWAILDCCRVPCETQRLPHPLRKARERDKREQTSFGKTQADMTLKTASILKSETLRPRGERTGLSCDCE